MRELSRQMDVSICETILHSFLPGTPAMLTLFIYVSGAGVPAFPSEFEQVSGFI